MGGVFGGVGRYVKRGSKSGSKSGSKRVLLDQFRESLRMEEGRKVGQKC